MALRSHERMFSRQRNRFALWLAAIPLDDVLPGGRLKSLGLSGARGTTIVKPDDCAPISAPVGAMPGSTLVEDAGDPWNAVVKGDRRDLGLPDVPGDSLRAPPIDEDGP